MIGLVDLLKRNETIRPLLMDLDKEVFMSMIATIIDQYAAKHNMSEEETFEMLECMADVQKSVHKEIGPYPKEKAPDKYM